MLPKQLVLHSSYSHDCPLYKAFYIYIYLSPSEKFEQSATVKRESVLILIPL